MPHENKRFITVFLGNNCNMRCSYCYAQSERGKPPQTIDVAFAKKGIADYFLQGHFNLRFFSSGEPTLDLDIIKDLYDYSRAIAGPALKTEIQTNGVMSQKAAQWVGSHINNIWVSWDGPPAIHDIYRKLRTGKPSSAIIERNARLMIVEKALHDAEGFVGARVTITDESLHRQKELIDYFASQGITYIYSDPVFAPLPGREEYTPNYSIALMEYVRNYLEAYEYADRLGIFYGSFYMINFDQPCTSHCRSCLPTPHLTYDGLVTCCDMCYSSNCGPAMKDLVYGYWNADNREIIYDQDQVRKIQSRRVANIPECSRCSIAAYCGGYCIGEVYNETKDFYAVLPERCDAIRYLASQMHLGKVDIPVLHP